MALSATLNTLKDRLQLFSREADTLTAICNSTSKTRTASCISPIVSIRPLPTEILDNVFSHLNKENLEPLLVTNSYVSTVAIRRFYHDVTLMCPAKIVVFLKVILANDRLPMLVRSLDINITKSGEGSKALPTSNFYTLLQHALQAMRSLASLCLELPKGHAPLWIFEGCTFRLWQLTTSMYCRRPLARFLETQGSIEELTLRGYQTDAVMFLPFIDHVNGPLVVPADEVFKLSPGALPKLRVFNAVHADSNLIRAVVQGRPVTVVSVPLFPDMSIASLDALGAANVPLKRLSVISFDPTNPGFMFEALAERFSQLEALHLVMLMAEYNQELLEKSGSVLAKFTCLKYITFMAAPSRPAPAVPAAPGAAPASSDTDDNGDLDPGEADVAKQWHKHCPTLRTIILPKGRVWFQNGDGAGGTLPLSPTSPSAAPKVSDTAIVPADLPNMTTASDGTVAAQMDMPMLSSSMEHGVQELPGLHTSGSDGGSTLAEVSRQSPAL